MSITCYISRCLPPSGAMDIIASVTQLTDCDVWISWCWPLSDLMITFQETCVHRCEYFTQLLLPSSAEW